MFVHFAIQSVGQVSGRVSGYSNGLPDRVSSSNTTIDGPNIHMVSATEDSQREISGIMVLSKANGTILETIHTSTTTSVEFDDGLNSYRGYLKTLKLTSSNNRNSTYSFTFMVTSRLT